MVCIEVGLGVRLPIRAIDRIGRRFAELVAAENSAMIATRKLVNRGISSEMGGYWVRVSTHICESQVHLLVTRMDRGLLTSHAIMNTFADLTQQSYL